MLKRIGVLCIAIGMFLTGCGQEEPKYQAETALEVLEDVWGAYQEEEKFPAAGGGSEQMAMNAPGVIDVTNGEDVGSIPILPSESDTMFEDGASILHMMNANTFTGSAFRLVDAKKMEDLAQQIKENCLSYQWMCGFPEQLLISNVSGDYIVIAYGNADLIETWKTHLTEVTGGEILVEESLI